MNRILVVDDQPENVYLLQALLRGYGFEVIGAAHGAEALIKAGQFPPDLIISDLLMPVMDGYTLLRQCKTDESLRNIPFVVYTATYTDAKDEKLAMDLGADAFMLKPAEPEVFMVTIRDVLDRNARGELAHRPNPQSSENVLLKQYSEVLVRKLEEKARLLEEANASLRDEVESHRLAREEQRRMSELLKVVTDGTTDAVFVKDLDGRYLLCNPAAAAFMGRTPEEVTGKADAEFFEAESSQLIRENDRRVMETGCTYTQEEVLTAAGTTRTYHATKGPYRDANGRIVGVIGISRDITDRKRAEDALREREEMLGLILNSTAEAIYGTDLQGKCTFANRSCARMLGYGEPSELIALDLHAAMHRCGSNSGLECAVLAATHLGQSVHLDDMEFWRTDGTRFNAEFFSYPIFRDGVLVGAVATFLDITKRKKLEEQLHQSQKMEAIGRLAGGVAHDFNNVLSVIIGYTDFALEALPENDPIHQDIQQIRSAADKAAALTKQLLIFSRKQVLKPEVIDLNKIIAESGQLLQRLLGEDIELEFSPDQALGCVRADAGQIEQVIMNLAVNARDAMPQGGKISIKACNVDIDDTYLVPRGPVKPGRYVMVSMTDTGCGMDAETTSRVFEPFFTTKAAGKGTGLGLATVYGIVEQSGGNISLYSEVGLGTTFKILLPRVDDIAGKAKEQGADTDIVLAGKETILLVEDDAALRSMTQRVLEHAGFRVLTACNGLEALQVVEGHNDAIDLVLTDVVMPRLSGRELIEQLTKLRPEIKVIYMSGFTDDAIVRHGISHDMLEFIGKPFTASQMTRQIREVLDRG